MQTLVTLAANPTITIPDNNGLGITTSATIGAVILVSAYWSTQLEVKANGGRAYLANRMNEWTGKVGYDWRSALYWLLGALGLTAILGSSGTVTKEYATWAQEYIVSMSAMDFLNDFLKLALCVGLVYMAMRKQNSHKGDLIWGTTCAVFMPILSEFGPIMACVVMVFMAMKNRDDSRSDIYWGMGCALLFPLAGGIPTWITTQWANLLSQITAWAA